MEVYYEGRDGDVNELCHFGVKGMKWGKRKAKYEGNLANARAAYRKKNRKADAIFDKASAKYLKATHNGTKRNTKAEIEFNRAGDKWENARKNQ